MLDSIYNMTLKLFWRKNVRVLPYASFHNVSRKSINHYYFIETRVARY